MLDDEYLSKQALKEMRQQERAEKKDKFMSKFYSIMSRIPIAGRYVRLCERMLSSVCPYDEIYLSRLAATTSLTAVIVSAVSSAAILLLNLLLVHKITIYTIACILFAIYVSCKEVLQAKVSSIETMISEDLIQYIASVKHNYTYYKNIPRAVLDAAVGTRYEMKLHAKMIYDILSVANRRDRVKEYTLSLRSNKFLKMFISQAYETSERGNVVDKNGESLFAKNMETLRLEVMQDLHTKEKRAYQLTGYTFVSITPLFFMGLLAKWGVDFSSSMVDFYANAGRFVMAAAFITTIISYNLINKAKATSYEWNLFNGGYLTFFTSKKPVKKMVHIVESNPKLFLKKIRKKLVDCGDNTPLGVFVLTMLVIGVVMFLGASTFITALHTQEKNRLQTDTTGFEYAVAATSPRQRELICQEALSIVTEFKESGITKEEVYFMLKERTHLMNNAVLDATSEEVIERIVKYQNQYMQWWEYVLAILFGFATSLIPYISLNYRHGLFMDGRDNEVRQFQSIILMERHFEDITVISLLEKMEAFAATFRASLRECIDSYVSGPEEALIQLKYAESGNTWFVELIDGLIVANKVGIKEAFDEVENNREMFERVKELEAEIGLQKKKDKTEIVALAPSALVLGGYFIVPFFINSMSGMVDLFSIMENLQSLGL